MTDSLQVSLDELQIEGRWWRSIQVRRQEEGLVGGRLVGCVGHNAPFLSDARLGSPVPDPNEQELAVKWCEQLCRCTANGCQVDTIDSHHIIAEIA